MTQQGFTYCSYCTRSSFQTNADFICRKQMRLSLLSAYGSTDSPEATNLAAQTESCISWKGTRISKTCSDGVSSETQNPQTFRRGSV